MLDCITFTGVDERTDLARLRRIGKRYPVEFAVLVGSHSGEKPIFPPLQFVRRFRTFAQQEKIWSAIHLCGRFSRLVLDGVHTEIEPLVYGFGRVQLNLSPGLYESIRQKAAIDLTNVARRVILQHRGSDWSSAPDSHTAVQYLFDRSGGRGIDSIKSWPPPDTRCCGYAGGLGLYNIDDAMEFVARWPAAHMWLDMESRVRKDGWFDLDIVDAICRKVFPDHAVE